MDDLTLEEIRAWIRRFARDPEFRNPKSGVPILRLCAFAGVPAPNLYSALAGDLRLTANHRARLSIAIRAVEAGLRWRRQRQRWVLVEPDKWEPLPRYQRPRRAECSNSSS